MFGICSPSHFFAANRKKAVVVPPSGGGLDANTKLYLPFDEATLGATTVDGALEVLDSGSLGKIITQVGTAVYSTTQTKVHSASLYCGNATTDGFSVNVSANELPYSAATVAFWLYPTDVTTYQFIYANASAGVNNKRMSIAIQSGNVVLQIFSDGGSSQAAVTKAITINQWNHVICTWTTNGFYVYVDNGTPSSDTSGSVPTGSLAYCTIGNFTNYNGYGLKGYLNDFRVYGRVITSDERSDLYGDGNGRTTALTADDELLWIKGCQDMSGDGNGGTYHVPDFIGTAQLDTDVTFYAGDTSSLLLDGDSDYVSVPYQTYLNAAYSNDQYYSLDLKIKPTAVNTYQRIFGMFEDSGNYWIVYLNDSAALQLVYARNSKVQINASGGSLTAGTEYHILLVKTRDATPIWAVYLNGQQVIHGTSIYVDSYRSTVYLGFGKGVTSQYFGGSMAHCCVRASTGNNDANYFGANPNSGKTDTITVPTAAYTA